MSEFCVGLGVGLRNLYSPLPSPALIFCIVVYYQPLAPPKNLLS